MLQAMSSIDKHEIANFSKDAAHWWDSDGPFKPLHRLNPVRLSYIRTVICNHFDKDHLTLKPFQGLDIIDIGCGGGLVTEPMARLGADVTGADADPVAIDVARGHAAQSELDITYVNAPAEEIENTFDVVLALEIIEHVNAPAQFMQNCARLCKTGGLVIVSTLNRTPKSYGLGIIAAERLLRWVPADTHQWRKFVKPAELAQYARAAGLSPVDISGLIFHPLKGEFTLSKTDLDVNYFMVFGK
jgi:2-polyprenyl-6-hydroxyphenyl methylase / 3-demethylubiquinone-9 3-methyltransferase